MVGARQPAGVEVDDLRGEQHADDRDDGERRGDDGEQSLRVRRALFLAALRRVHEQRDDDARQHATEQQVVEDVGDRVGDVVGVGEEVAERGGDDDSAQEAADARGERAGRHRETGTNESGVAHAGPVAGPPGRQGSTHEPDDDGEQQARRWRRR